MSALNGLNVLFKHLYPITFLPTRLRMSTQTDALPRYTPATKLWGILESSCPSVHPSVCLPVYRHIVR